MVTIERCWVKYDCKRVEGGKEVVREEGMDGRGSEGERERER